MYSPGALLPAHVTKDGVAFARLAQLRVSCHLYCVLTFLYAFDSSSCLQIEKAPLYSAGVFNFCVLKEDAACCRGIRSLITSTLILAA
jgi:hypothetical protein